MTSDGAQVPAWFDYKSVIAKMGSFVELPMKSGAQEKGYSRGDRDRSRRCVKWTVL